MWLSTHLDDNRMGSEGRGSPELIAARQSIDATEGIIRDRLCFLLLC
jgi:hypothetical protein